MESSNNEKKWNYDGTSGTRCTVGVYNKNTFQPFSTTDISLFIFKIPLLNFSFEQKCFLSFC